MTFHGFKGRNAWKHTEGWKPKDDDLTRFITLDTLAAPPDAVATVKVQALAKRTLWQRLRDAYRGMLMGWRGEI